MCLGVPGQVVEIVPNALGMTMGKVSFGGIVKEVCLAFVPEAEAGDWVLVHVGFAMSRIDEQHAREIFDALAELEMPEDAAGSSGIAMSGGTGDAVR